MCHGLYLHRIFPSSDCDEQTKIKREVTYGGQTVTRSSGGMAWDGQFVLTRDCQESPDIPPLPLGSFSTMAASKSQQRSRCQRRMLWVLNP